MNQMSWCGPPPYPPMGCPPLGGLEQCWNDVQALEALLTKIIKDLATTNPGLLGQAGIKGVIDGSRAAAGDVGELIGMSGSATYPANTIEHVTLTTMGTLPAGDWDIQAWVGFTTPIDAFALDNIPTTNLGLSQDEDNALIPPGMSWIGVALAVSSAGTTQTTAGVDLSTIKGFLNSAGPTQIVLRTIVDSGNVAGTANLGFLARRVR